jgi:hypothetical protein
VALALHLRVPASTSALQPEIAERARLVFAAVRADCAEIAARRLVAAGLKSSS